MNALIFGGTGKTGSDLLRLLHDDPYFSSVTAVVRKPGTQTGRIREVVFDFRDWKTIEPLFTPSTAVFCAIGTTRKKTPDRSDYHAIDVGIPEHIALCCRHQNVPALAIVSSVGADPNARNFYLQMKGEMELRVAEAFGPNVYIMRPSLLLGHRSEDRLMERAAVMLAAWINPVLRGSREKYRGIDSQDVARAMIFAVKHHPPPEIAEFAAIMRWSAALRTDPV